VHALAADGILVIHFAIAAFIMAGLPLTWIGAAAGWRWVRNPWFRYGHLAAIGFVAIEALLGYACPLTVWEDLLRGGLRPESFVGRWAYRLLYYRAPEWVFTTLYVLWAAASVATLYFVPCRSRVTRRPD
jgi:polyferredoxin